MICEGFGISLSLMWHLLGCWGGLHQSELPLSTLDSHLVPKWTLAASWSSDDGTILVSMYPGYMQQARSTGLLPLLSVPQLTGPPRDR